MFKKTDKSIVFHVTDRTLNNTVRVTCLLVASALTLGFFGTSAAGATDDIYFQVDRNPLTTTNAVINYSAKGISANSYSVHNKLASNISANTYEVKELTDDNGIPVEILDTSEFTPDGSHSWVSCTKANVRSEPSVSSDKVTDIAYSDEVILLSYGTSWSKIKLSDGQEGYVLSNLLSSEEILAPTATPTPTPVPSPTPVPKPAATATPVPENPATENNSSPATEAPTPEPVTESEYNITVYASCSSNLRSGPGTDCSLVKVLNTGDEITVVAQTSNGWYKTANGNYIKASLCTEEKPYVPEPSSDGGSSSETGSNDLANYCLQFIGCAYVYAGSSPSGFDCSGFVMYVYANYYGISLPHSADSIYRMGYEVSSDVMEPGDVVCNDHNGDGYIDHVSIYIGDGYVVHASTSTTGVIKSSFADLKDVVSIRRLR